MASRVVPGGLRGRLALAISLIVITVLGGTFFALHEGTGADLRNRIDSELEAQWEEFRLEALPGVETAGQLGRAGEDFLASQRYHPQSRIFVIEVAGRPIVTNQREVIEREVESEESEGEHGGDSEGGGESEGNEDGEGGDEGEEGETEESLPSLLAAPPGLATVTAEEAGRLRVLSQPIVVDGSRLGTFRVADPLNAVNRAQEGLRDTFLVVGAVALVAAIAIALWVATLVTRPLRRIARFASAVDAGDLTRRIDGAEGSDEVRRLAEAFNHMLDRLEDAFGRQREFVADASHELRTPLTVLRGEIELLVRQRGSTTEDDRRSAALLREIDRMDRLVGDMLMLAGVESGRLIERRPIELEGFFADLRRDLPLLGGRDYRVGDPPSGVLEADPDRLAQVLRNLVRNAVAHTEPSGSISLTATQHDGTVEFAVSDDGPGIEPQQLDRIFDRFHRTQGGRGRDSGGSGLGLAIARAIVEAHGGRIWAESEPGHGATIRFEVPGYTAAD